MALSTNCNSLLILAVVILFISLPMNYVVESFQFQLQNSFSTRVYHQTLTTTITSTSYKSYRTRQLYSENNPKEEEIVGDQYEGSVDWDAEWQKVVKDQDQPSKRPGEYKTQVEIAAIKATNKVAKNVFDASQEVKSNLPKAPSIRSLQGDWRFWIGILVIVSFGLSLLTATSVQPTNESFYI